MYKFILLREHTELINRCASDGRINQFGKKREMDVYALDLGRREKQGCDVTAPDFGKKQKVNCELYMYFGLSNASLEKS